MIKQAFAITTTLNGRIFQETKYVGTPVSIPNARLIEINPMNVFTHHDMCARLEVEINAMERHVNRQQTIKSMIRSTESDAAKDDGWNPKDVTQAIMEDSGYVSDHNVLDYSNFDSN